MTGMKRVRTCVRSGLSSPTPCEVYYCPYSLRACPSSLWCRRRRLLPPWRRHSTTRTTAPTRPPAVQVAVEDRRRLRRFSARRTPNQVVFEWVRDETTCLDEVLLFGGRDKVVPDRNARYRRRHSPQPRHPCGSMGPSECWAISTRQFQNSVIVSLLRCQVWAPTAGDDGSGSRDCFLCSYSTLIRNYTLLSKQVRLSDDPYHWLSASDERPAPSCCCFFSRALGRVSVKWKVRLSLDHLRVRIRTSTTSSRTTGPTPVPSRPSQTSKSTPLPPRPTTTRSYPRPEPSTSQEGNDTAGLPAPIVKASRRGFSARKMIANWAGLQRSSSARGNSGGTWCGRLGGGGGISAIFRGGSLVSPHFAMISRNDGSLEKKNAPDLNPRPDTVLFTLGSVFWCIQGIQVFCYVRPPLAFFG